MCLTHLADCIWQPHQHHFFDHPSVGLINSDLHRPFLIGEKNRDSFLVSVFPARRLSCPSCQVDLFSRQTLAQVFTVCALFSRVCVQVCVCVCTSWTSFAVLSFFVLLWFTCACAHQHLNLCSLTPWHLRRVHYTLEKCRLTSAKKRCIHSPKGGKTRFVHALECFLFQSNPIVRQIVTFTR